jgi:hypothetical protein
MRAADYLGSGDPRLVVVMAGALMDVQLKTDGDYGLVEPE